MKWSYLKKYEYELDFVINLRAVERVTLIRFLFDMHP